MKEENIYALIFTSPVFAFRGLTIILDFVSTSHPRMFLAHPFFVCQLPQAIMSGVSAKARVVSYNVLSAALASPSHFKHCSPAHLAPGRRFEAITKKVERELKGGRGTAPVVFCLQEVPRSWSGRFSSFFQQQNYHYVESLYGGDFSDYMGIVMAFPNDVFELADCTVQRVSETRTWPRPAKSACDSFPRLLTWPYRFAWALGATAVQFAKEPLKEIGKFLPGKSSPFLARKVNDPLHESKRRHNTAIFARLRFRSSGLTFCVTNYHMPCAFFSPPTMVIHAALVAQLTQRLAGADPHVLCGDFNLKPGECARPGPLKGAGDASYHLLTNISQGTPPIVC